MLKIESFIWSGETYTLELRKMITKCDECGGNLTIDLTRAEGICDVCSLVHPIVHDDADTNSGSSLGEGRHNEAVNMEAGHGGASGRFKRLESTALEYAFVFFLAGIEI